MNAIWRIELLGGLRVQLADRVITHFPTQKTAVLLAYLAYHHQHPHPRDALIDQLWPEIDLEAARSSLRSALYSLRHLLEPEDAAGHLLLASRSTVSLHPDAFTTDVADFRAALHSAGRSERPTKRAARLSGALAGYRGELLPGSCEPWILQERRFLGEAYLEGLHQLVTALEQDGELERALEVARQAVSTDPLRDEAHFDLMRLYAAAGQPSAVLRQYQELERLLRQELGEPPSGAARALADELRQRADDVACHRAAEVQRRESPAPAMADPRPTELPPAETPVRTEPPSRPGQKAPLPGPKAPLRSPPFHRNLPLQLTRFIGRSREMAEVQELLGTSRLLTLTGAGGCGKTRLALEVAAQPLPEAGEGIWLVELAPLSDPERLPQAITTVLEAGEERFDRAAVSDGGRAPGVEAEPLLTQTLVEHLKPRCLLLLLDNCEHLLSACAQLVERLLRPCPQVRILATSREGLGLPGEQIYRVPSLLLPEASHLPPVEELQEFEAVKLFADRAALSQPGFAVTPANAPSVVQICRQLDGMPLAIELAAVRVKGLPVEQLAARLDDRFRLLTGGSRTALPRQQTLQATLDWSYDLLSEGSDASSASRVPAAPTHEVGDG
jgi:DNA-binding SARP family transcriptional activator